MLSPYLNSQTDIHVWMMESCRLYGTSLEMIDSVGATDVNHYNATTFVIMEISPRLRSVIMKLGQQRETDVEAEY